MALNNTVYCVLISLSVTAVFFNLFVAAEPLQAVKSVAEPYVKSVRLCKLNVIINSIVAYTVCW